MHEVLWLVVGLLLVGVVVFRRTRRILAADFPGLRAVEGLAVIFPLFLLVFAALYLSLSAATATTFSEELDHTRALYFAITVFSTVGFGDITPTTDIARIVVSIQMLLDLVVISLVVHLYQCREVEAWFITRRFQRLTGGSREPSS